MNATIGAGFNPALLSGVNTPPRLSLPRCVDFIEGGIGEWLALGRHDPLSSLRGSLHLARTPITEAPDRQAVFLDYLAEVLGSLPVVPLSIGLHLTGSRYHGNGLLGGADRYLPSAANQSRAKRFITELQQRTGLPVWLENANFYSDHAAMALHSWQHTRELSQSTGCRVIVDLAHLAIEARNTGTPPEVVLGAIPWDAVAELHLSGIRVARDGSWHDGHGEPVHDIVWSLLDTSLALLAAPLPVIYTIEHTAPGWAGRAADFAADFAQLEQVLATRTPPANRADRQTQYMQGYLRTLIHERIPLLGPACAQRHRAMDTLLADWLEQMAASGRRVVFDTADIPYPERADCVELCQGFLAYAKTVLKDVEVAHGR